MLEMIVKIERNVCENHHKEILGEANLHHQFFPRIELREYILGKEKRFIDLGISSK